MSITDFKVGQTVVLVGNPYIKDSREKAVATVTSIGRKYLFIDDCVRNKNRKFSVCTDNDVCLIEQKDFGCRVMLFPTETDADAFIEMESLRTWIIQAMSPFEVRKLSLEQLRSIKTIYENGALQ